MKCKNQNKTHMIIMVNARAIRAMIYIIAKLW